MVRVDLDLVGCPFTVSPPVLEGVHYCQEFFVVDLVIDFHGLKLSGVERHWVQAVFVVPL